MLTVGRAVNKFLRSWSLEHLVPATEPLLLARFDSVAKCAAWRVSTDAEFGGRSRAAFDFDERRQCGVFRGWLDLSTEGTRMKQSGFAAITMPRFAHALDLTPFDRLRFRMRARGSVFISNIKTDSRIDDDLFQCFMLPGTAHAHAQRPRHTAYAHIVSPFAADVRPAHKPTPSAAAAAAELSSAAAVGSDVQKPFEVLDLPFRDYALTWRGFVEDEDVQLDPFDVVSLGILMAERRSGAFELDLHSIEAVTAQQVEAETKRFQC